MKTVVRSQISILTSPFKQTAVGVILGESVHGGTERISQAPTQRVKELMPQMASRVADLEAKVKSHLVMIGFVI